MKGKLLTWRQRGWLWLRLMVRLLLALLAAGLIVWVGRPLLSLLAPFVAALITAAILNPLVRRLQRRLCWSRRALTMVLLAVLFGLLGAGLGFLGYIAGQEIVALAQNWNGLLGSLQSMMDQLQALSDRLWALVPEQLSDPVQGAMSALLDWLNQTTPALVQHLADYTTDKAMGVPSFCVALVVYVMAAYFLTADYPYLRAKAARGMDQGLSWRGENRGPGGLRRLFKGGAAAVRGGVLHPAGGLCPHPAALRPASGIRPGGAGLYPHRGGGDGDGPLGGG